MRFVWDERKNLDNIKKHGFSFTRAIPAFSDPLQKEYYDEGHSTLNEDRFLLAGYAENAVLLVSFTEPEPEVFRIISARKADTHEEEKYYGNG